MTAAATLVVLGAADGWTRHVYTGYAGWADRGAAFHYVSGSPWQLYRFITGFLDENGFPPGSAHLKNFRLTDRSSIRFLVGDSSVYPGMCFLQVTTWLS